MIIRNKEGEMTGQIKNKDALKLKCQLARQCPFFAKYRTRKSIAWLGILSSYCCSDSFSDCKHYILYQKNGRFAASDVMPSGGQVSAAFQSLP